MKLVLMLLLFSMTTSPFLVASLLDEKRAIIAKQDLSYIHEGEREKFIHRHLLVELKSSQYLEVNKKLAERGCWIRPWVLPVLNQFAESYYKKWGKRIRVNSALRTVEYHHRLRRTNTNAAKGYSPHSTGATVDISHLWFSREKMRWAKEWWAPYIERRQVIVTTEFFQQCWDIFFLRPPALASNNVRKPRPMYKKRRKAAGHVPVAFYFLLIIFL